MPSSEAPPQTDECNLIYAPTRADVEELAKLGFDRSLLRILPRGVDTKAFCPEKRNPRFWEKYNLDGGFKFIYVGRISHEKNVDTLLKAYQRLLKAGVEAGLAVGGDGPELAELKANYAADGVAFTGCLHGDELPAAYASADALVFDTFGNVVLEAHASGLPAIVSSQGGPQEIVRANDSGYVVDADRHKPFAEAMIAMAEPTPRYRDFQAQILLESWRWCGADGQRVDIGHLLVDGVPQTVAIDRAFADERRLLMDVIQAWSVTLLQDWQRETNRRRGRRPSILPPALHRNLRRVLDYVQDPYYQLANR